MTVVDWLLDADPSIRWQVMRDLTDEPASTVAGERSKVATEGWGAQLLSTRSTPSSCCGSSGSTRPDPRRGVRSASSPST